MVIATLIILLLLIIAFLVWSEHSKRREKIPIPFKESMDLLNVPVVTFVNNDQKLHFLLDTGGDYSYIDSNILDSLAIKSKDDSSIKVSTGSTGFQSSGKVTLDIDYRGHIFEETFVVHNLKEQFASAFSNSGLVVHGVLGSMFFAKHKYELNFEDFTAYSAK